MTTPIHAILIGAGQRGGEESHLLAFAAERSRLNRGQPVGM